MTTLTDEDVEEVIRILDSSFYGELRIKTATFELSLRRSEGGWTQEWQTLSPTRTIGGVTQETAEPKAEKKPPDAPEAQGVTAVRAPMVGIFYRAPKPGAPPFVDIGAKVDEHSVIGIIEVMKLMNSVSAGASGTVSEICVEDGQLVETGQTLIRLRQVP